MAKLIVDVVVGGGISGLCSAKLLTEYGLDVLVLEARDRVGGRTQTIEDPAFKYIDLGGSYVGPDQHRILHVAEELGVETYPVQCKGKTIDHLYAKAHEHDGSFSTWNPLAIIDYLNVAYTLDKMCDTIPLEQPWEAPQAIEWDHMTAEEFFNKVCWTSYCKKRMVQNTHHAMAVELWEISLLHYLWYRKSGNGVLKHSSADDAEEEKQFVGGAQQISNKLKKRLGDKVIVNSPVLQVNQEKDHVIVTCKNRNSYQSKYVISAIPQALLNKVSFVPPLSPLKNQLIQRFPMGSSIKTFAFYETAFWKSKGLNGVILSDFGPIHTSMDDTKPGANLPVIMGIITGDQARYFCNKTQKERKQAVCEQHAKVFGCKEALNPVHYVDKDWLGDEYSGGCYVGIMPCGVMTKYGKALRCPIGRLHFAGTETATISAGYMDGAVRAGERAAREILSKLRKIAEEDVRDVKDVLTPRHVTMAQRCLPTVPAFLVGSAAVFVLGGYLSFSES
ncbi:amine oxidase [flavin-containing] B-like isoform X2 [Actinia tenebrosa]|uniref:Amine oxidase n=1 Tax=Actinia tenebrosa TaxID=6105 RepID=A0A6P8HL20_ACTTE|nr:amine oxidase [flavin-containing] B-like isoform X2 [Actinia tenebrosa]